MQYQKKAYFYASFSILAWSTVASAFKIALRELQITHILFIASLTSAIALLTIIILQAKIPLLLRQTRREISNSAICGLFNPFLYYLVLFKAYYLLPAQQAQPLNFTWPIVLSLLSIPLLHQPMKLRTFVALLVSFSGVLVISTHGDILSLHFSEPLGVFLATGSSVIWALFWILNVRDHRDNVVKMAMVFSFGTIYITITLFFSNGFSMPMSASLIAAIYIGLFEMGLTFLCWLNALRLSGESARISNLAYLAPFLSLIFINRIVGEEIHFSSIAGLTLIVSGILIQSIRRSKASG